MKKMHRNYKIEITVHTSKNMSQRVVCEKLAP